MNADELSAKLHEGLATKQQYAEAENVSLRTVERRIAAGLPTIKRFGKVFVIVDKAAAYMRGEQPAANVPRGRGRPRAAA